MVQCDACLVPAADTDLNILLLCAQELERGDDDICEVDMHNSCVLVNETKLKVDLTKYAERHQFNFDEALDEYVDNDQVSLQGQRMKSCLKTGPP